MERNRYVLCLLLCSGMIYYAGPRLDIFNDGIKGVFAISWLLFALMVIAGNLSALLFSKKQRRNDHHSPSNLKTNRKIRSYHG
ncbi:hypothetical protein [Neobacillus sp. LXY-4]|uniref:hypothetical protein n=1 Tax=Neobacillus sp. LXY-4 TaxID=3379826 RepID=UPI003EE0FEDD